MWQLRFQNYRKWWCATKKALEFYVKNMPNLRIILWSVYDLDPIYDGEIKNALEIFNEYSDKTDLPKNDDDERREAKIRYMQKKSKRTD